MHVYCFCLSYYSEYKVEHAVVCQNKCLKAIKKALCSQNKSIILDKINGYSTEMAITDLYNRVVKCRDKGYNSCCLFLDLSKAFDTVNHKLLLNKLNQYGIREKMFDLLSSYLTNRKQFTECNNIKLKVNAVVCGIPQGSTLRPLLFSLYINDMPLHTNFHVNLFADDTVLIMKNKNINQLQQQVNRELGIIDEWMKCNNAKTSYIVYTPKCNSIISENFCIKLGNHDIPFMDVLKYLGVVIDKQLNWNAHIDYTVKKLSYAARIFPIIRHYVNKHTLIKLYFSFTYSHIKYGIVSWVSAYQTYLEKIQVMQNNITRIIE